MAQVGVVSAAQLMQHSHLNASQGGILNAYSRYGAFRRPYRTGALAVHVDNDAEVSQATVGFELLKQFTVGESQVGETVLRCDLRNVDNVTAVSILFSVNGVPLAAAQSNATNVYATKSQNFDAGLVIGDVIQIWGDSNGDTIFVRNFRAFYDWRIAYFGDGTFNNLAAPLLLTDTTALDLTADF